MLKVCSSCQVEKDISLFSKARTCVDSHRSYCKACHKIRKDKWRMEHKEHHNAKSNAWAAANRAKRKAICSRCNTKRVAAGKSAAAGRAWRIKNPDRAREQVATRRCQLRNAAPPWVDRQELRSVYREAAAKGLVVDHIVPITHDRVCGLHVPWNLQLLTRSENCKKHNKFETE